MNTDTLSLLKNLTAQREALLKELRRTPPPGDETAAAIHQRARASLTALDEAIAAIEKGEKS